MHGYLPKSTKVMSSAEVSKYVCGVAYAPPSPTADGDDDPGSRRGRTQIRFEKFHFISDIRCRERVFAASVVGDDGR